MPANKARSRPNSAAWRRIRLFAMDVDGILTDGTIFVGSDGVETKQFSILDGLGLVRLIKSNIAVAWISGRMSGATLARANELKIPHVVQGRTDKLVALRELADRLEIPAEEIVYMGDDDIDAPAIRWAGIGVSVKPAMPAALKAASYVTARSPGLGAVREVCENILSAKGLKFTP